MTVPGTASWPGHDGGAWAPVPGRIVASWPAGYFAENVAVAGDGTVLVSLHSHNRIDRYRPDTGELDVFCQLPAPATGLAFDAAGVLWVTGGEVGRPPGYVWRADPEGEAEEWVEIADALFLNGCAVLSTQQTLLVAESLTGRVLAVDQRNPAWSTWVEDARLRPEREQMPGANGIKLHPRARFTRPGYASLSPGPQSFGWQGAGRGCPGHNQTRKALAGAVVTGSGEGSGRMAGPSPAAIATSRSSREARLACAAQPGKHHLTSPHPKMIFVTCKSDAHPGPSRPVVHRGTGCYADLMTSAKGQPAYVSVRQFVADSGAVTRGLRQGRAYTLTLNGEPLARMVPIRRRQAVPREEVLAIFATAPVIDVNELRSDLDAAVAQDLRDPYEGTGL